MLNKSVKFFLIFLSLGTASLTYGMSIKNKNRKKAEVTTSLILHDDNGRPVNCDDNGRPILALLNSLTAKQNISRQKLLQAKYNITECDDNGRPVDFLNPLDDNGRPLSRLNSPK